MSEYKRMVSYFYRYENGEKQNNVGYARLECRQDVMRLVIQINDEKCIMDGAYVICLYKLNGEISERLELGKTKFENQRLKFRCTSNENDIMGSKIPLSECDGIMIYYNNRIFYASQWSDKPINVDKFAEKSVYQKVMNKSKAKSAKIEDSKDANVDKFAELEEKKDEISENYENIKRINNNMLKNVDKLSKNEKNVQKEEEKDVFVDKSEKNVDIKAQEEEPSGIPYLLKHRTPLPDFANHEVMQCVRIMPEDIGFMNRRNWEYGNNSFVMHGFYNYHYLLLGCMQFDDGKKQYILGVPGIFSNKDRYLAGIFGFQEFIPLRSCLYKTGEFGYWISRLSE